MGAEAVIAAAALARRFEGLYLKPYLCPALVPTIGYGSTRYENGRRVLLNDPPITKERAEQLLQWELRHDMTVVLLLCAQCSLWGPKAVGALMDFVYNLGESNLAASTLRKCIQNDDMGGAKRELMKWVRGGGRILPGLVKRRAAEAMLIGA